MSTGPHCQALALKITSSLPNSQNQPKTSRRDALSHSRTLSISLQLARNRVRNTDFLHLFTEKPFLFACERRALDFRVRQPFPGLQPQGSEAAAAGGQGGWQQHPPAHGAMLGSQPCCPPHLNPVLRKHCRAKQVPALPRPSQIHCFIPHRAHTQRCTRPIRAPLWRAAEQPWGDPAPQWGAANSLLHSSLQRLQALPGRGGPGGGPAVIPGKPNEPGCWF